MTAAVASCWATNGFEREANLRSQDLPPTLPPMPPTMNPLKMALVRKRERMRSHNGFAPQYLFIG
ncbi:MAG: hypothetical protein AAF329_15055 [Cyanobacteria bacterium P01_A01_bin.17]